MNSSIAQVSNLFFSYGDQMILREINLCVEEGQRWAVIGKNGTGKSTLIKTIAGLLAPGSGSISIFGKNQKQMKAVQRAKYIAYVPQKAETMIPYTVYDFIMLGRYARMGFLNLATQKDREAVWHSLGICDIRDLAYRQMGTLSGGETQRVFLAGALAQEAPLLLLDEPTTFLDPAHERLFLLALEKARKNKNISTIMVTHDINSAICSCTHIFALRQGTEYYSGTVDGFLDLCPDSLEKIYGIEFKTYRNEDETTIFGFWSANL